MAKIKKVTEKAILDVINKPSLSLKELIDLADDVQFYKQEAECPWIEAEYLTDCLKKHNRAKEKLVDILYKFLEHKRLDVKC